MVEEISEYYKKKGYIRLYVNVNKEFRRVATLRKDNGEMHSMAYAKYLYTSYYQCDVADGDQVDHIDGNKMNDTIENLQVISHKLNGHKNHSRREMVLLKCPICNQEFLFPKKNLPFVNNPCCSKECGSKKTSLTLLKRYNSNETEYKHKCLICGKPFRAVSGKKYCSKECRDKAKFKQGPQFIE